MEGGPPIFPRDSSCPVVLWILLASFIFRLRDSHALRCAFPHTSTKLQSTHYSPKPRQYFYHRFSLLRVRSPLLAESRLISSPAGTEMFHFPASRFPHLWIQYGIVEHYFHWVSPFGYLRIKTRVQFPEAFRSLPRPSSPDRAKASFMCP